MILTTFKQKTKDRNESELFNVDSLLFSEAHANENNLFYKIKMVIYCIN